MTNEQHTAVCLFAQPCVLCVCLAENTDGAQPVLSWQGLANEMK